MKLLIFAHTPPPFHGQSYIVGLMIEGLGGDCRSKREQENDGAIQCFHVNARFSDYLADIGSFHVQKIFRLIKYCSEAIWCRFRYGADTFYYVPAPPKRMAFYRDCLVLLLCRPFFSRFVFHWHASGLAQWLQHEAFNWERWIAQRLLGSPDLSIALASSLSNDAAYFHSRRISIMPNGIPDPCPAFEAAVLPYRAARLARRQEILERKTAAASNQDKYRVVFLAHCTREKGLFDALEAIALANRELNAQGLPLQMHLTVAGAFLRASERREFESWKQTHSGQADYIGFIDADMKIKLLQESDCLCFPTYYSAEGQPVSIIEAMAFGLSIVATNWRAIPEMLPTTIETFEICNSRAIAEGLRASLTCDQVLKLRRQFLDQFTEERFLEELSTVLIS